MIKKPFLLTALVCLSTLLAGCEHQTDKITVAVGPAVSATEQLSHQILQNYGIKLDALNLRQERFVDALDGVEEGDIDLSLGLLGLPAEGIERLQAATGDVKLLGLSDEVIAQLEQQTGYRRFVIPKGSYKFVEQDVLTVAAFAVLMANTQTINDEMGYQLAKTMYEQAPELNHAQARFMTLENALKGGEQLPIHPGAKRFYEEQGLTVNLPVAELGKVSSKSEYLVGTGSNGGDYYSLGNELTQQWSQSIPGTSFTNLKSQASLENLANLNDNKLDLGMTVQVAAIDALAGRGHFAEKTITNIAFIGQLYPEVFQAVTRSHYPLNAFDDLQQ